MKYVSGVLFILVLTNWGFIQNKPLKSESTVIESNSKVVLAQLMDFAGPCDSVTIFAQQLHTVPASCCFQLIIDNKLRNAITQIKLDINTATFTNIVVQVNSGWIASQTLQKDILLSHNSGFIPTGGSSQI